MKRIATILAPCCLLLASCAGPMGPGVDARSLDADYIGGWDAEGSDGAWVLLLREGLQGTLSGASLVGRDSEFEILFEVEGEVGDERLTLGLNCAEARERRFEDAGTEEEGAPDRDEDEDGETEGEDGWTSVDCAGWDLDLGCGLAGDCDTGDCNMVCDVTYFGDAYAHSRVALKGVEDELDYWQRV